MYRLRLTVTVQYSIHSRTSAAPANVVCDGRSKRRTIIAKWRKKVTRNFRPNLQRLNATRIVPLVTYTRKSELLNGA